MLYTKKWVVKSIRHPSTGLRILVRNLKKNMLQVLKHLKRMNWSNQWMEAELKELKEWFEEDIIGELSNKEVDLVENTYNDVIDFNFADVSYNKSGNKRIKVH